MAKRKQYRQPFAKSKITWVMTKCTKRPYPFQFPTSKGCKKMTLEDKIDTLPDDVLITILSHLTFNEAAATSILSRRWRYLWTSLPSLYHRFEDVLRPYGRENQSLPWIPELLKVYMEKLVLMFRKGQELQEFSINYPILESSSCRIDPWVAFAIAIGVSKIELNFSVYSYPLGPGKKDYSIPIEHLDKMKGMEHFLAQLERVFSIPTSSLNIQNCFKSLRDLSLKFVDLTDEQFEAILSSCTSLGRLHLLHSRKLVNAKHSVSHKKLKCLEIYHCSNVENIEISAPNLVSFKYVGAKIAVLVKDAKQLVNLCMCSNLKELQSKDFVFPQFAQYLSQLENLMMSVQSFKGKRGLKKVPSLHNLKHLSLTGTNDSHGPSGVLSCYQMVVCLVKESPFLRRLELHFSLPPTTNPELRRIITAPHKNLKEVLVSGFYGNELVMDLIMSISIFAVELEKIEITTVYLGDLSGRNGRQGDVDVARRSIAELHQKLPAKVQLCFLDD